VNLMLPLPFVLLTFFERSGAHLPAAHVAGDQHTAWRAGRVRVPLSTTSGFRLGAPLAPGSVLPLALFSVRAGAGSRFGKATPAGKPPGFKLYQYLLPLWLIPHRYHPRAELQPAHELQVEAPR
jgi:hypothetical protein